MSVKRIKTFIEILIVAKKQSLAADNQKKLINLWNWTASLNNNMYKHRPQFISNPGAFEVIRETAIPMFLDDF